VDADILGFERRDRYFKVDANGIAPISIPYSVAKIPSAAVERCPDHPRGQTPNDEIPENETIAVVNFDDWVNVATVQPIRHDVIDVDAPPHFRNSVLSFSAWNAKGGRVRVDIQHMPQAGSVFETSLVNVAIQTAEHVGWSSRSGRVTVADLGTGALEITLSDVVLEKGRTIDEPAITRVTSGNIIGTVQRRCQAPSWSDSDSSWSAEYCEQIRRIGGF